MKKRIVVNTDKYLDVPWPESVPLPEKDDVVILQHKNETIACTVSRRIFSIGKDPLIEPGTPLAVIIIEGKSPEDIPE